MKLTKKKNRKICEIGMSFDKFRMLLVGRRAREISLLNGRIMRYFVCVITPDQSMFHTTSVLIHHKYHFVNDWLEGINATLRDAHIDEPFNIHERQSIFPPLSLSLSISYCRLALISYPLQSCRRGSIMTKYALELDIISIKYRSALFSGVFIRIYSNDDDGRYHSDL